ncbi:MAG: M3 family oligoendopeptidase, partial [Planctomycetes bacterium]|nr:M3 family oligoendopeptidase [Planctomycetota bacterium]
MGGIMVEWRGERRTPQRCMAELALPERGRREGAWRAVNERYLRERDRIDALFDEQLALRHRMAQNAGYESYRAFRFAEMGRFDYSPEDCTRFHDAAGEVAGPLLRESQEERRRRLDLGQLRPWDLEAELRGTTPEPLFATQEELIDLVRSVLGRVDRRFAAEFELLVGEGMLDLMSREGKAPGGYNCLLEDVRLPFIFFNAVGRPEDLRTLLHEAGHAFHSLAARDLPLIEYRHAPLEFCEVASMSMELFGLERLGEVIDPSGRRR